ncbi:hypothetical protein NEIMUCOT_04407 [Neisseria mucosa ATCC 25996]|uniref:Uncharacterized protein n=1 Tax=Neisseria mucosa (strain ATCC 25996 / DSM 4631 / NCTC 10774 / M26) TaxID=546266 RepID=D2ZUW5_NEIM2|nr:hypothetical protein NEIMUCOT_04407 [Neisseria mucosa ATCC 25996]
MNLPEYINKKMARWPFFVGVEKLAYYNRFPLKRKALIYRGFFSDDLIERICRIA